MTGLDLNVVRCAYCRRAIHKQRNGEWYHTGNASVSCRPGWTSNKATPGQAYVRDGDPS